MTQVDRRSFLRSSAKYAGSAIAAPSLLGLAACNDAVAPAGLNKLYVNIQSPGLNAGDLGSLGGRRSIEGGEGGAAALRPAAAHLRFSGSSRALRPVNFLRPVW